jgi:hypothetical protein
LRLLSADDYTVHFRVKKEAYEMFRKEVKAGNSKISTIEQFTTLIKMKLTEFLIEKANAAR